MGEKVYQDTRKRRIRQVWGEAHYREVERQNLEIEMRRHFKIPTKETRTIMERTVEAFLAGKLEPFKVKAVGHNNAARRMHRYMYQTDHPKKRGKKCWRSAEVELERRFLSSIFFHTRDEQNEEADWETGEPVKPWISISACDGSAVYLYAIMNGDEPPGDPEEEPEEETEETGDDPEDSGEEETEDVEELGAPEPKKKKGKGRKR